MSDHPRKMVAIDLGKFRSVACVTDAAGGWHGSAVRRETMLAMWTGAERELKSSYVPFFLTPEIF